MAIWWVGLGGFLGANARYLLGGFISERWGAVFPYGTFVINITGSFILGFFMAYAQDRPWVEPGARLLFAVGFVGAYTTFSTFEYETMRLLQEREDVARDAEHFRELAERSGRRVRRLHTGRIDLIDRSCFRPACGLHRR